MAQIWNYCSYYCCCCSRLRPGVASGALQGKKQMEGSNRDLLLSADRRAFSEAASEPHAPNSKHRAGYTLAKPRMWTWNENEFTVQMFAFGPRCDLKIYINNFYYVDNAHCRKILTHFQVMCIVGKFQE